MTVVTVFDGELEEGGHGPWVEVPESANYVFTGVFGNADVQFSLDAITPMIIASQPKQISPANGTSERVTQMLGVPVKYMRAFNRDAASPSLAKVTVLGLV